MKIAVFGAGAVGSVVGGLLSQRHEVTLIARREHAEAVKKGGLRITGDIERTFHPAAVTSAAGLPEQELVLITTKAYDTAAAADQVAQLVGQGTLVVSLQNGLGNDEIVEGRFGDRAVVGVPILGATYLGPGYVRLAGLGEITVGHLHGDMAKALAVRDLLSNAGMSARAVENIQPQIWMKAIVNASINPITALVRKENGSILGSEPLLDLSRSACREGAMAARANGVCFGSDDPLQMVLAVLRTTAANRSSMLQDVERSKRTEIDQINGELVRRGEGKGLPMPVNRALWALVRSL
jgi:2-dehydropantoate 2-reductase